MDVPTESERKLTLPLPFCSIQVLDGLDDAQCIGEGDLLYSSTGSNANLFQKYPHRPSRSNVLQRSGHPLAQ